ncbi:hypothetical protein DFH28DRAFT_939997 [Melampsora americana]|nr:hypothetical protein DFH28DRAFT_939997 [Melampsora americana]
MGIPSCVEDHIHKQASSGVAEAAIQLIPTRLTGLSKPSAAVTSHLVITNLIKPSASSSNSNHQQLLHLSYAIHQLEESQQDQIIDSFEQILSYLNSMAVNQIEPQQQLMSLDDILECLDNPTSTTTCGRLPVAPVRPTQNSSTFAQVSPQAGLGDLSPVRSPLSDHPKSAEIKAPENCQSVNSGQIKPKHPTPAKTKAAELVPQHPPLLDHLPQDAIFDHSSQTAMLDLSSQSVIEVSTSWPLATIHLSIVAHPQEPKQGRLGNSAGHKTQHPTPIRPGPGEIAISAEQEQLASDHTGRLGIGPHQPAYIASTQSGSTALTNQEACERDRCGNQQGSVGSTSIKGTPHTISNKSISKNFYTDHSFKVCCPKEVNWVQWLCIRSVQYVELSIDSDAFLCILDRLIQFEFWMALIMVGPMSFSRWLLVRDTRVAVVMGVGVWD